MLADERLPRTTGVVKVVGILIVFLIALGGASEAVCAGDDCDGTFMDCTTADACVAYVNEDCPVPGGCVIKCEVTDDCDPEGEHRVTMICREEKPD